MAANNAFSRFLIVNGQPILIKNDLMGLNQTQSLGPDILQQAIDDATSNESCISAVINCNNDELIKSDQNSSTCEEETSSVRNEYVTVLSSTDSDQNQDETSTIRLTLDQAAELGLHFAIGMDQMLEINTINGKENCDSPDQNQFSIPISLCDQQKDQFTNSSDSEMPCTLVQNVEILNKSDENNDYLSPLNSLDTSNSQQLSLVPQIINGTVTYTLQLTNQQTVQTNELFQINPENQLVDHESSIDNESLKLGLNNISATTDLPFIPSGVDLVSDKHNDKLVCNSKGVDPNESYGLVSCGSDNVTFLNLSEAIPVGTSLSNIVSNLNRATQDTKLTTAFSGISETLLRSKSCVPRINESDSLLKQKHGQLHLSSPRSFVSMPSVTNNRVEIKRSKVVENVNICDNTSTLISSTISESSAMKSSNFNLVDKDPSKVTPSKFRKTSLNKQIPEEMDVDLHSPFIDIEGCDKNVFEKSDSERQAPTIITPTKGDLPKEVSMALRRIPIKTNVNKPLGSNENPIQLVQQGSTFHSMQALTEDHISKIKPILQENFDTKQPSKNVVFDPASNTRIIYRIISPAEVSLRKQEESPRRRGRPKKTRLVDSQLEHGFEGAPPPKKVFPRTRSGRLSRPPKHMVRDYKHIRRPELDDSDGGYSDYQSENEAETTAPPAAEPVHLLPGLVAKAKNSKRNISAGNLCPTCGKIYLGNVRMQRHFDKYPDHGSIEYLNAIRNSNPDSEAENQLDAQSGLWKKGASRKKGKGRNNGFLRGDKRTRLKEALDWCESKDIVEIAGPAVASALSLWELLLLRADCVKQDSQVAALYQELRQLLSKLKHMAHRLLRPLDHALPPGTKHITVQVEDEMMTGLLNLPCGVYLASDEDLHEPLNSTVEKNTVQESKVESPLLPRVKEGKEVVESSKHEMNIEDVPQQFLLPGEEMICDTDDRGLVNVDDIVSERLENFTRSQSAAVDELMTGLNELDQRNKLEADDLMEEFSIVSQTNHVSASTEDLMKSLEHFDAGLNSSDPPGALDRDTFDRVTNVDTLDFEVLSREFHSNNR